MSQYEINTEVNLRLTVHDEKSNAFLREMRDFKEEMRRQNRIHAQEIVEWRKSIKEISQAIDAKIARIEAKLDAMHNQNIFVIIGVIAIAVAVFLK